MSKSDYSLNRAEQKVAKLVHDFMFADGEIFVEISLLLPFSSAPAPHTH